MTHLAPRWFAVRAAAVEGVGRYGAIIRSPLHRTLIGASALSDLGDWLNIVALTVLAWQVGDGVLAVGLMLALRKLPGLLLQLPAGALIDRAQGPSVLIASQLVLAVIAASFSLLLVFPSLWLLSSLVILLETVNVITFPAFRAAVARWTDESHRGTATALLNLEDSLASLIGPVIGGVLLAVANAGVLFVANSLSYLVAAGAVWWVWQRRQTALSASDPEDVPGAREATIPGLGVYRAMLRRTDVVYFGFTTILGTMIYQGAIAIFVVRAIDLGFGAEGLGIFLAALAAGSLFGGLVAGLGRYVHGSVLLLVAITEGLNALGFGLFAVLPSAWLVVLLLVVVGSTSELAETPALTYFQNILPEAVYGRFFSLFLLAVKVGAILGLLLVPWLGMRLGEEQALLVLSIAGVVFAGAFGIWVWRWLGDTPPASREPSQLSPAQEGL